MDCYTHAQRLKEYLEENIPKGYNFEIINAWNDPGKTSFGNLVFANHYMVRAISLKTGHSYICDGYVLSSVKSEKDDSHIIFNEYEECMYNQYLQVTRGDGLNSIRAQWMPMEKGLIAVNGKASARICLSGASAVILGDSIFDPPTTKY